MSFVVVFSYSSEACQQPLILLLLLFHFKNTLMLAMNFRGPFQIRADRNRPEPEIKHPYDAIVRVTRSLVCGSDLHLYHGMVPDTRVGMTFGHEFTGVVEAVGSGVQKLKVGDQVLVPFNIACGSCPFASRNSMATAMRRTPKPRQQVVSLAMATSPVVTTADRQSMFAYLMRMLAPQ